MTIGLVYRVSIVYILTSVAVSAAPHDRHLNELREHINETHRKYME